MLFPHTIFWHETVKCLLWGVESMMSSFPGLGGEAEEVLWRGSEGRQQRLPCQEAVFIHLLSRNIVPSGLFYGG